MTASLDDVVTTLQTSNQNAALLVLAVRALVDELSTAFPKVTTITTGTFTCANATSTTVSEPLTAAASFIALMPTNAAAGTLMSGANSLYVSARTADTSFAVSTAGGGSAAGTETFQYLLVTI